MYLYFFLIQEKKKKTLLLLIHLPSPEAANGSLCFREEELNFLTTGFKLESPTEPQQEPLGHKLISLTTSGKKKKKSK